MTNLDRSYVKWFPPNDDIVFKLFCAERPELLHKVLSLMPDIPKLRLPLKFSNTHFITKVRSKLTIRDCIIRIPYNKKKSRGEVINIEMQNIATTDLAERMTFYSSQALACQNRKKGNYFEFLRVRTILLLNENIFNDTDEYYTHISLMRENVQKPFTDLLHFHIYELQKIQEPYDELTQWLKFFSVQTLEECMELAARNPDIKKACEYVTWANADKDVRELLIAEDKRKTHEMSLRIDAEKRGEQRGEQNGEKKAMEKVASKLLSMNLPIDQIIEATGLSSKKINQLKNL